MNVLKESKYARTRLDTESNTVVKEYTAPSPKEAATRARDINLYYRLLHEAGVQVPWRHDVHVSDCTVVVEAVIIKSKETNLMRHDNCFHQIANGCSKLQDEITLAAFQETLKIARAACGDQPIGYDISPQNYVYDDDGKVYCVDFYPPRLGFNVDTKKRLPVDKCLVDYPNGDELEEIRMRSLQKSYYTPAGMLRQFAQWFVATRYAREKKSVDDVVKECQDGILAKLRHEMEENSDIDKQLRDEFNVYLNANENAEFSLRGDLKYRLPRVRNLWYSLMKPSTLVVAAAGKGSRARDDLKVNKLAFEIGGDPFVWHVAKAICEDIKISKVLFVIDGTDNEVKEAIEKKSSPNIEYSLVESKKPGAGVGHAFYEGMKEVEKGGSVVLSVGDTLVYDAAGLFVNYQPIKAGVCRRENCGQETSVGKERTETGDNKWIGIYYIDGRAMGIAKQLLEKEVHDLNPSEKVRKNNGEYRFSWLIEALWKDFGVGFGDGFGDVGKVAEINFGNNVADIENMLKLRKEVLN